MKLADARALAAAELKRVEQESGLRLRPIREVEQPNGWVFTYGAVDKDVRLAGGFIYVRKDGTLHYIRSVPPIEREVEALEKRLREGDKR